MADRDQALSALRARIENEARVSLQRWPISFGFDRGALAVEGEVESVAAKKRVLELAAVLPGIDGIIDRLHVAPSQRMPDGALADRVVKVLSEESSLLPCALCTRRGGRVERLRPGAPEPRGQIELSVALGVVTLDGEVPSLAQKRLAESLAWWVPGTRDVVNGLGVTPPEEDSDDEIREALRMVLEKDPLLKGLAIGVRSEHRVVTLTGRVRSEAQRRAAEEDGWCLFGVDRVVSRLELGAP